MSRCRRRGEAVQHKLAGVDNRVSVRIQHTARGRAIDVGCLEAPQMEPPATGRAFGGVAAARQRSHRGAGENQVALARPRRRLYFLTFVNANIRRFAYVGP